MGKFFIDECLICKQKFKKNDWVVDVREYNLNPFHKESIIHVDCLKSKK